MLSRTVFATTASVVLLTTTAMAETWDFDIASDGEDVFWTSPTPAEIADCYETAFEVTQAIVTVRWTIFTFDQDVTEQIPPEFGMQTGTFAGPPPVVLASGDVVFPPPPEEPGFAGTLELGINAEAFGELSLTNILFGDVEVDLGDPFGVQTVTVEGFQIIGTVEINPGRPADINCDGFVDFADLLLVLSEWGPCEGCASDIDGDGMTGFGDLLLVLADWG